MDGKLIATTGMNWLLFMVALVIVGIGLYLVFLAAQSMLRARQEHRFPVAAFAISVLAGVVFAIPFYPVMIIQQTNVMLESAEPEVFRFVDNMGRIMRRGFAVANATPDPNSTPTPIYTQNWTPVYETPETAVPTPTPTFTPVPILTVDPQMTPLNTDMMPPPTPTIDVAALTTRNAERIATQNAPATYDPALWNPQTPPPTPSQ